MLFTIEQDFFLELALAAGFHCRRPVRVAVAGVRVHRKLLAVTSPSHGFRLPRHPPPVVRRGVRVHHQRPDGRQHGDEPGEREIPPRAGQVRRGQAIEGVRQHVDEPRRQDDAGGEGLHHEEHVPLWAQRRDPLPDHREAYAGGPRRQDGGDRRGLVLGGEGFVPVLRGLWLTRAISGGGGGGWREEEEEQGGAEEVPTGPTHRKIEILDH
ncbi:homolog of histone chaperone HIRA [Striga asiatica]|uniref:Homolog of histone chaperone HIRA n=1 Tax=Striga asiatica TaxID=4170 RepID=A0A5A7R9N0_STRAF|nr:homolog of histone chaperone HIRA [Striga asiatica]